MKFNLFEKGPRKVPESTDAVKSKRIAELKTQIMEHDKHIDPLKPENGVVGGLIFGHVIDADLKQLGELMGEEEAQHWYNTEVLGHTAGPVTEFMSEKAPEATADTSTNQE